MGMPPQSPTHVPPPYGQSRAQWKAQRAHWKMQARMQRAAYRASYGRYSRGSLVGPLLLIGIGVIALLMTLHRINAFYFWEWYGHWWPLILIGAGVILALESLAFSSSSRIRLGGGVILLGIILAFVGIAAAHHNVNWSAVGDQLQLNNGINLPQIFGQKHETTEQILHALPDHATLIIQNQRGDVTVTSGNDGQMHLTLDKTVYTGTDTQAKRMLQDAEPLITTSGSVVTIHMPSSPTLTADMTMSLPGDAVLQVQANHGNVTVNGRQAPVTINSNNGDVELSGLVGSVHATMHQGDFSASGVQGDLTVSGRMNDVTLSQITGTASMDGDFFGDVHLENLHGAVHFHSSRTDIQLAQLGGSLSLDDGDLTVDNATGPVSVSTRAMEIELQRITGPVRVQNSNGGVEVKVLDPVADMNVDNRNGSVQVTVPPDSKFSVEATAVNGEVHTDFNLATKTSNNHSSVSGSVGGGGPLIHITADTGDVTLHKGGANNSR